MSDTTHPEITAAVDYLCSHLSTSNDDFKNALTTLLTTRYNGHWHPTDSEKGSAFRAMGRSGQHPSCLDAILKRAVAISNVSLSQLASDLAKSMASDRWTLWIDPGCVSIRMHDAAVSLGGQTVFGDVKASAPAGIKEIWGKLPASLGISPLMQHRAVITPAKTTQTRGRAPSKGAKDASVAAEFDALVLGASPSKRSKAIAIVRPGSAAANIAPKRASTPPPPLPPLAFTIEESTSPYVPSFAGSAAFVSSSRSPTPTPPLPLPSSPLAMMDRSDNDPFARPSSRSSTTSVGSNTSCSIFSHASSESRSSSIGSFSTMASNTAATKDNNASIARATPFEMNAAAMFQFPGAPASVAGLSAKSAPCSPSKNRRAGAPRHAHTLSTSSAVSATSSTSGSVAGSGAAGAPSMHQRGRSSQSNIRISTSQGTVQDYSNGKVGVLGGGVLLGLAGAGGASKKVAPKLQHRPSSSSSSSSSGTQGEMMMGRPRSKSRTPSASGSVSGGQGLPMWYNQHQYNPMPVLGHHAHSWSGQMAH